MSDWSVEWVLDLAWNDWESGLSSNNYYFAWKEKFSMFLIAIWDADVRFIWLYMSCTSAKHDSLAWKNIEFSYILERGLLLDPYSFLGEIWFTFRITMTFLEMMSTLTSMRAFCESTYKARLVRLSRHEVFFEDVSQNVLPLLDYVYVCRIIVHQTEWDSKMS